MHSGTTRVLTHDLQVVFIVSIDFWNLPSQDCLLLSIFILIIRQIISYHMTTNSASTHQEPITKGSSTSVTGRCFALVCSSAQWRHSLILCSYRERFLLTKAEEVDLGSLQSDTSPSSALDSAECVGEVVT